MNDIITLLWTKKSDNVETTSNIYRQSFEVDYLVNDSSRFINGFDSLASDPIPEELVHAKLDTELPVNQVDNRILYFTPRSTPYSNVLTELDPRFVNNLHPSGEAQAALQILSETFSGYMIPLAISTVSIDLIGTSELYLGGLLLYRYDEEKDNGVGVDPGGYELRAQYIFKLENRAVWNIKFNGVLRLVNTSNSQDTFGVSLIKLDKFAGIIINKAYQGEAVSTIKTFENYMNALFSISNFQYQNGHITGAFNEVVPSNTLTYYNRKTILQHYNFREFK